MATETREKRAGLHNKAVTRRDISGFARDYCRSAGNAAYLIAEATPDSVSGMTSVLVSNWSFDTIEDVGLPAITRLIESSVSTFPGTPPRGWHPLALAAFLACDDVANLCVHDHEEMFLLKLPSGKKHYIAVISGTEATALDSTGLSRLQMGLCHLLSGFKSEAVAVGEPLSERERECLYWASEGKTADEVSLIINVSSNTVNSYVAHAIHKLAARNRAMAIATAIRNHLI
ncbi:helix-turn-helix transcriptional regulator [uncultured Nitratireductor sp.]|uniref:helix-turn-helix transcriptional regulator n=1 Tax=uncultured Nitratireductor sp. TaxID=520953 RepID=UPI0025E2BE44|nr:helix-turn-helix transcriptional regulator [uncultured Nitratireductor sp.]